MCTSDYNFSHCLQNDTLWQGRCTCTRRKRSGKKCSVSWVRTTSRTLNWKLRQFSIFWTIPGTSDVRRPYLHPLGMCSHDNHIYITCHIPWQQRVMLHTMWLTIVTTLSLRGQHRPIYNSITMVALVSHGIAFTKDNYYEIRDILSNKLFFTNQHTIHSLAHLDWRNVLQALFYPALCQSYSWSQGWHLQSLLVCFVLWSNRVFCYFIFSNSSLFGSLSKVENRSQWNRFFFFFFEIRNCRVDMCKMFIVWHEILRKFWIRWMLKFHTYQAVCGSIIQDIYWLHVLFPIPAGVVVRYPVSGMPPGIFKTLSVSRHQTPNHNNLLVSTRLRIKLVNSISS